MLQNVLETFAKKKEDLVPALKKIAKELLVSVETKVKKEDTRKVNILLVDLENFLFNTLSSVIKSWDIKIGEINKALQQEQTILKEEEEGLGKLGHRLIDKYADEIAEKLLLLIRLGGQKLKEETGYGFISVAIFTAQRRNKPFLERVRKKLISKLQKSPQSPIVRFEYSANQKENDDYLLEGIIETIFKGDRSKLIPNPERFPKPQRMEYELFIKATPKILLITNDKRLKERIAIKFSDKEDYLSFGEAVLNRKKLSLY